MDSIDSDEWPKHHAKKDTRNWCKGKVGREHVPGLDRHRYLNHPTWGWIEVFCMKCGKRLKGAQIDGLDLRSLPIRYTYENGILVG